MFVCLVAATTVPLTVTLGVERVDRENGNAAIEEITNHHANTGFSGYGKIRKGADLFLPSSPACGTVLKAEGVDLVPLGVENDDIVMIFSPIEPGEM